MSHGRSPQKRIHALCTLAGVAAIAGSPVPADATAGSAREQSGAAALAVRVAAATDAQLVIALRQQVAPTQTDVTYSDAARQLELEYMGPRLYAGDVRGTWFAASSHHCYATTRERFVGLTSIGMSLLPQASVIGRTNVTYRQVGPRVLRWTIAANGVHGVEQGTVWFSRRDLILRSAELAYKSGGRNTAQATTVTLTYPRSLPATLPTRLPSPVCGA